MTGRIATYGKGIALRMRGDAFSWLSFSALLAWMFGLYWSDVQIGLFSLDHLDLLQMRTLWLGAEAATLLVVLVGAYRLLERFSAMPLVAGIVLFSGTVLALFGPMIGPVDVLRPFGVALTGVGSAILLAVTGVSFARKGARSLLVDVALALSAASLLDAVVLFLAPPAQQLVLALLPGLCSALLVPAVRDRALSPSQVEGGFDARLRLGTVRIVALPAIVGSAYGLMQRLAEGTFANDGVGDVATIASFVLSALVIALAALFFDSRRLVKVICFAAIPVIGFAFVMLPLFSGAREAVLGVCIVGFNSFYFMVWALWAGKRNDVGLLRRFALGLLVLVASECLGSLLGAPVAEASRGSGATLAVVSLVVVYLLLMAGILSFDRSTRARHAVECPAQGFEASADTNAWTARFGLSTRESEVFEMLARGRNRSYISKTLVVSDNTTRTHMKNVYRKLGVHSQQELIDLVESAQVGKGEPW